jgi:hypothetical protein
MSAKREYSRPSYCAVVRSECPYPVEVAADGVALAYPFVDYRKDWASRTRDALRPVKIGAFVPHETYNSNYLICHICQEIRARPLHLSEVTQPNWNVFFEAGLAFGFGKTLVMAENSNENSGRARQVFSHYLRLAYENVDELTDKLLQVDPQKALNISAVVAEEDPRTLYFVDPGIQNDFVVALRKMLSRKRGLRYASPEGGVLRSPTMHTLVRDIKGAGAVIGLLIPESHHDYDIINARASFLLGIAVALEKRVLVFLQEPVISGPADLGMLTTPVGSVATMNSVASEWVNAIRAQSKSSAKRPEAHRANILEIDLGNAWAERDPWLEHYFIETGEYRRARDARSTVFLGRKGSGKSAIGMRLTDAAFQGHGLALRMVRPEEFEMTELQQAYQAQESNERPNWHLILNSIWRYLLLGELAQAYREHFQSRAEVPSELDAVLQLSKLVPHKADFVDAVLAVTKFAREADEPQLKEFLGRLSSSKAYAPFKALAKHASARVVIDNLDATWDTAATGGRYVLASLIREAERLNQHLAPKASILLFMRTDIYDVVKLADPDVDKQSRERIRWDRDSLVEVIGSRLKYLLDLKNAPTREAWYSVFPHTIEGVSSAEFMVSLTMRRPRELIKLCASALETAQSRRAERVSESDVLAAWVVYSDEMLTDLHGEYLIEMPDLYTFCLELANQTWPIGIDEARGLVRGAARTEAARGRSHKWLQDGDKDPDSLIRRLYEIGILGLTDGTNKHFSYDRDWLNAFANSRRQVEVRYKRRSTKTQWIEPSITLHPGLLPILAGKDSSEPGRYREWERTPTSSDTVR